MLCSRKKIKLVKKIAVVKMTIFLMWCNSLRQRRKDEERTQNKALMTQEQGRSARRECESASLAWQRRKKSVRFCVKCEGGRGEVECNNTTASCTTSLQRLFPTDSRSPQRCDDVTQSTGWIWSWCCCC